MRLGLLPDISSIINSTTSNVQKIKTHWHNYFQGVQGAIESGQPTGIPIPVVSGNGVELGQCIRSCIKRVVSSTSTDLTISASPQISAGFDGQEITLEGTDNTKTVTLHNGDGLQLAGAASITLKNGDVIKLHYNADRKIWIENYRSINS